MSRPESFLPKTSFIIPEALSLLRLEDPYLDPKNIWYDHVIIVVLLVPIN